MEQSLYISMELETRLDVREVSLDEKRWKFRLTIYRIKVAELCSCIDHVPFITYFPLLIFLL